MATSPHRDARSRGDPTVISKSHRSVGCRRSAAGVGRTRRNPAAFPSDGRALKREDDLLAPRVGGYVHATRPPFDPGSPGLGARARVVGVVVEGLEPGARRGSPGAFLTRAGPRLCSVSSSSWASPTRIGSGTKKGDQLVALAEVRSAPRSYRASLPARVEPGVNPHVRSHCSWRVPIKAWMSAEFFINVGDTIREALERCQEPNRGRPVKPDDGIPGAGTCAQSGRDAPTSCHKVTDRKGPFRR